MKHLFFLFLLISQFSFADCLLTNGHTLPEGEHAVFYFSSNPQKEIGPLYTCVQVSRVRTCVDGVLSNQTPECRQQDSGGCVDNWLTLLNDGAFTFTTCQM